MKKSGRTGIGQCNCY